MGDAIPHALNLIRSYLEEEGSYVLASPEDADFFRKLSQKKSEVAKPAPTSALTSFKCEVGPTRKLPRLSCRRGGLYCLDTTPLSDNLNPGALARSNLTFEACRSTRELAHQSQPTKTIGQPARCADLSSVHNILSTVAPELAILNKIPNDATALKIAQRWKTKNQAAPISLLVFQEPPEQRALLEQIAKALDVYFGPAKIINGETIEKEKQWETFLSVVHLKMIIVCDYTLWQLHHLMQFYKETPAQGTRTLRNTPVLLLPDLSLYLKDPLLKRSLWKALCQKFS